MSSRLHGWAASSERVRFLGWHGNLAVHTGMREERRVPPCADADSPASGHRTPRHAEVGGCFAGLPDDWNNGHGARVRMIIGRHFPHDPMRRLPCAGVLASSRA